MVRFFALHRKTKGNVIFWGVSVGPVGRSVGRSPSAFFYRICDKAPQAVQLKTESEYFEILQERKNNYIEKKAYRDRLVSLGGRILRWIIL